VAQDVDPEFKPKYYKKKKIKKEVVGKIHTVRNIHST
jgi:hypothetical protein